MIPNHELHMVQLTKRDSLIFSNSNNADLNDFLKNDALRYQEDLISITYLCFCKEHLVGFLTLVTDTIEFKLVDMDRGVASNGGERSPLDGAVDQF